MNDLPKYIRYQNTPPLITYYGGKQRIASWICEYIPKHTVYVEPFAGSAAVFFKKQYPKINNTDYYREVLNDTNEVLITLYRVASDPMLQNEFINRLDYIPFSQKIHDKSKELNKSGYPNCSDLDIAVWFYININQSFGHEQHGGWSFGKYGSNNARVFHNKIKNLPKIIDRLNGVYIDCNDAIDVINRWDSPQTFFYCDPPYIDTDQGHYSGYTIEQFQELINTLDNIQGSFLLSHYKNHRCSIPETWEKFSKNSRISIRNNQVAKNKKRTEVLYRKLASTKPNKIIQQLYSVGAFDCFLAPGWKPGI